MFKQKVSELNIWKIFLLTLFSCRICHLVSFGFSFTYLIFFRTTIYFGIPYAPSHTNLIIMIQTLKLVGLAFELNTTYTKRKQDKKELNDEQIAELECKEIDPGVLDIFTYAFNYVGLLAGNNIIIKYKSASLKAIEKYEIYNNDHLITTFLFYQVLIIHIVHIPIRCIPIYKNLHHAMMQQ